MHEVDKRAQDAGRGARLDRGAACSGFGKVWAVWDCMGGLCEERPGTALCETQLAPKQIHCRTWLSLSAKLVMLHGKCCAEECYREE